MHEPIKAITLKISQLQAVELFGILDSSDEKNYAPSIITIYDQLHKIATDRFISQQIK
jgi:hypothetical protein